MDITALQRMPGTFRTAQLRHLLETAALPSVTIQVVPVCWHSGMSGGFILTDRAAYAEAVHAGRRGPVLTLSAAVWATFTASLR